MSDPDDDLHGRQLALLLLFFTTVGASLYLVFRSPAISAAIAGALCYPARWLVEHFDWWNRLEQPTRRTQARRERARSRALAKARQRRLDGEPSAGGGRHSSGGRGRPWWFRSGRLF